MTNKIIEKITIKPGETAHIKDGDGNWHQVEVANWDKIHLSRKDNGEYLGYYEERNHYQPLKQYETTFKGKTTDVVSRVDVRNNYDRTFVFTDALAKKKHTFLDMNSLIAHVARHYTAHDIIESV